MAVINRSIRSASGGGSFNIENVKINEETQKLDITSTKENGTFDKKTPIAEVSLDGKKIPVVNGRYNIVPTISEDGNTQILDIADWNYSDSKLPEFDTTFANNTPEQISAVSAEIAKNNYTSQQVAEIYGWNIGDKTSIALTSGETIEMQILGFNHDNLSDGTGKAGITLQMVNCIATTYQMNTTATNEGGYAASQIKTNVLPTLKNLLPPEWQAIIKFVDKKSANGGSTNYTKTLTLSEDLFLLSEIEVSSSVMYAQDGENEGTIYEYYVGKDDSSRIKMYDYDADGSPEKTVSWWLRSCTKTSLDDIVCVRITGGFSGSYSVTTKRGISFGFCI